MEELLFVGTYCEPAGAGTGPWGRGGGVHVLAFDAAVGSLRDTGRVGVARNPSFLAVDAGRLYCVEELAAGGVVAFRIGPGGALQRVGEAATAGSHPCHVAIGPGGLMLAVANYSGGGTALLSVGADGALARVATLVDPAGSGPHARRQAGPHPHSAAISADGRHLYVTDLGADAIYLYRRAADRFDAAPVRIAAAAGMGPRQMVFGPGGAQAYVVNELGSSVTVYRRDAASGMLEAVQTVGALPEDFSGDNTTAELQIAADGRHVYASNRGHDSLAVFARGADGRLTAAGHAPVLGRIPRCFAVHASGRWVVAANQESDALVVFARDPASGALRANGVCVPVGSPVCARFGGPLNGGNG